MQTGLISLEVAARINGVDLDSRAIVREHGISGDDISTNELIRIARNQKFRAKLKRLDIEKVSQKYPLPAIIVYKDESYGVLLNTDENEKQALIFIPGKNGNEKIVDFAQKWERINYSEEVKKASGIDIANY